MADRDRPKKTSRSSASKPAARKPAARKPTTRKSTAKPTARASSRAPEPADARDDELDELDGLDETTGDDTPAARPVAVAGTTVPRDDDGPAPDDLMGASMGVTTEAEPGAVSVLDEPRPAVADEIEHPTRELGVGLLAAALAVVVFFPWYRAGGIEASGWSSGTWGPVVLGLAVAAVAIVILRRLKVAMVFPVHHSLILEGIGWASVALLLIKLFFAPRIATSEMEVTTWLRPVALVLALLLALVGGSVSQGVAVVMRPGFLSSAAGKLGTGILALGLLAGGVFGVLNDVATGLPGSFGENPGASLLEPGYPRCAERVGVPIPEGVEALSGPKEDADFCLATLRSDLGPRPVLGRYIKALRDQGWKIVYDSRKEELTPLNQLQAQRGQDCVSVTVTRAIQGSTGSQVTLVVGPPNVACSLRERIQQQQGGGR